MKRRLIALGLLASLLGVGIQGLVVVKLGEEVVVRRLGRLLPEAWGPGLHWAWPFGIDRLVRVRIAEIRQLRIGLVDLPGFSAEPGMGEYQSGDENLIRIELLVRYRVSRPAQHALAAVDVDQALARIGETGLIQALGCRNVDAVLRDDRPGLARDVQTWLDEKAKRAGLGIEVLDSRVVDARPPHEVAPEFLAAQSARSDATRRINEAKSHAETLIVSAQAAGVSRIERARGEAARTLELARAQVDKFNKLRAQLGEDRAITLERMYITGIADSFSQVESKLFIPDREPIDLSLFGLGVEPTAEESASRD